METFINKELSDHDPESYLMAGTRGNVFMVVSRGSRIAAMVITHSGNILRTLTA